MEQTIVDFFSKSSELILTSRLRASKTHEQANSQITNSNPLKFQLNVPQKFNFNEKIPPQWSSQHNKLLVIEFFLRFNSSKEKVLIEQWSFELNEVSDTKIKFTIDSQNTLYKKLSVLLRTISLLTVTLPLYKGFVSDKSSPLLESCTLEHSINFTRHNLSNWHPRVYEEKNYTNYTNPDFVLPGRTFSFKVAYAKSLGFVQSISDESITPKSNNQLNLLKHKLDMDYFGKKMRERVASEDISGIAFQSTRKSTSDSVKATISANHLSPRDPYSFGNEAISETTSPFGSLLTSSPIETQKSPTLKSESRPRRSSGGFYPWDLNKASGGRPRFATIDSEKSGEYEMYIYEDAEFTEVLSGNEVSMRDESPSKFSAHPKGSGDEQDFAVTSRKLSMQDLKLSGNVKPIEKIIEHSDDDKIADIMKVVDELKDHYADLFGSQKMAPKRAQENKKNINNVQKGLKFQSMQENDKNMTTLASDFELLGNLYAQLKR